MVLAFSKINFRLLLVLLRVFCDRFKDSINMFVPLFERQTLDRKVVSSILTGGTVLCP